MVLDIVVSAALCFAGVALLVGVLWLVAIMFASEL